MPRSSPLHYAYTSGAVPSLQPKSAPVAATFCAANPPLHPRPPPHPPQLDASSARFDLLPSRPPLSRLIASTLPRSLCLCLSDWTSPPSSLWLYLPGRIRFFAFYPTRITLRLRLLYLPVSVSLTFLDRTVSTLFSSLRQHLRDWISLFRYIFLPSIPAV